MVSPKFAEQFAKWGRPVAWSLRLDSGDCDGTACGWRIRRPRFTRGIEAGPRDQAQGGRLPHHEFIDEFQTHET